MTSASRLLVLLALPMAAAAISGCEQSEPTTARQPVVAVEGQAEEVLDVGVFVLTDAGGDNRDPLLIIDRRRADVRPGQRVRVAGELRPFRVSEASRTLGRPLDEARLVRFEGTTYVDAQRVEPVPPRDE